MEFKLKTVEQSVKKEAAITSGIWGADASSGSDSDDSSTTFGRKPVHKRTKRGDR